MRELCPCCPSWLECIQGGPADPALFAVWTSAYLGVKITDAVITVPHHFSASQRAALRASAKHGACAHARFMRVTRAALLSHPSDRGPLSRVTCSAGLNILRLLSEPVATALAMNADRQDDSVRGEAPARIHTTARSPGP